FLKGAFHYGETKIGLLSIARPLSFSLTAPVAGYLAVRWGERLAAIVGCAFVVASMLAWSQVDPGASNWAVMGALALAGVALGVVQSYHEAYLLAGAACVLGLVCALFVRSAERGEREPLLAPLIREAA